MLAGLMVLLSARTSISGDHKAPNFVLEDLNGKKFELEKNLDETPIFISFWATWCKPCIKELDQMKKVQKELEDKKFQIIAIDEDGPRTLSKVKSFVKSRGWKFPVLLDKNKKVYRKYQVVGLPYSLILDKNGTIIFSHSTYRPGDEKIVKKKILELISEQEKSSEKKEKEKK
ncbi:MAG: hypothetical protein AMJ90_08855 [candidate division Zixibacteria bacterium SM23_73_2]|nr:MAG: hypothetical protein AMJ90_08855 [candidate division Zixibacteria bacterium SM23_73_2]